MVEVDEVEPSMVIIIDDDEVVDELLNVVELQWLFLWLFMYELDENEKHIIVIVDVIDEILHCIIMIVVMLHFDDDEVVDEA